MSTANEAYRANMRDVADDLQRRTEHTAETAKSLDEDAALTRTIEDARQKVSDLRQLLDRERPPTEDPADLRSDANVLSAQIRVDLGYAEMRIRELASS
jgi:hypothetical protein